MTELQKDRYILMRNLADVLEEKEMTEKECINFTGLTQGNFRTLITSMTERFLIYEYRTKRNVIYGILK